MKSNPYQRIEAALLPGETLLWTGHPYQGFKISKFLIFPILFFLLWGGIPTCIILSLLSKGANSPVIVCLCIFPIITVLGLFKSLVLDTLERKRTCYALSDRHVLIASEYRYPNTFTLRLEDIKTIEVHLNDRGHGSIKCFSEHAFPFDRVNKKGVEVLKPLFRGVAEVQTVFDLLDREIKRRKATEDRDN